VEAVRADLIGPELDRAIKRVQQIRVRRYFKKTKRDCSEFGRFKEGAWAGMYSKQADLAWVERFFKNPDAWMAKGKRLKSGNTCTVQHISVGERSYVLKRYNRKAWWIRLRHALSASRACRSWSNGWVLNLCHIPTARPVAFAEEGGFPRGMSYLLMEAIDGELLPDYVEQHAENAERMKALVEKVGRIWDLLGQIRAVHGDLKATNWMVDEAGQVFLFDLDSFCCGLTQAAFRRGRNKDMRRFLKNWAAYPSIADSFLRRMETKKGAAL
jgi:tRNA A-37 threonylcarbamoyl transferase component Bud32